MRRTDRRGRDESESGGRAVALVLTAALCTTLATGANASAGEDEPNLAGASPVLIALSEAGLSEVGFDPEIAIANGADVRYTADGVPFLAEYPDLPVMEAEAMLAGEASGPTLLADPTALGGLPSNADATPDGVVTGSCGSSYIFLYDLGNRRYLVETGFQTNQPSTGYTWSANVIHPNSPYNYTHRWHGVLAMNLYFEMRATADVRTDGWATSKATGWAVLWNGILCRSLGPTSTAWISD